MHTQDSKHKFTATQPHTEPVQCLQHRLSPQQQPPRPEAAIPGEPRSYLFRSAEETKAQRSQLLLLTISIFLGLGQPRNPKGKRKGQGRPGTLAPGPQQVPLDLVSRAKPFARMEEYEKNLGDMVAQLRNSSELAKRKCEVNLQLWLSNQRSLSPWGYSINHDPSRIPADLPEARCLCLGCVNPFTMQEDRSMVSVPVFSQVPVRRRLCPLPPRTGPCRQRAVMETIAVGCTCIF
uniref:Interleukin-17B n=1 Tax=Sus scrofa TaxID=9823 RepID=A0A8D0SVU4_PIG